MSKEIKQVDVKIGAEKITFKGKTLEEIREIAKANNEARKQENKK